MQVAALEQMMGAASRVLPDESIGLEFEDMQWLNPEEVVFWHPNVREYLRLMRRCEGYCKQNPRLWPLLEDSRIYPPTAATFPPLAAGRGNEQKKHRDLHLASPDAFIICVLRRNQYL